MSAQLNRKPQLTAWLQEIKDRQDETLTMAHEVARSSALLFALTKAEGHDLWETLKAQLASIGKECAAVGVNVEISDITNPIGEGAAVRISSVGVPRIGELRSLDVQVWYEPENRRIRCYSFLDDTSLLLKFCVADGHLAICDGGTILDPKTAASRIIQPTVKALTGHH